MEGAGRGRGQLRHPPRITRGGLVKCFSGGEGKALLLTTNGQGQKERINSRLLRGSK